MIKELTIRKPDDWHLHLRDGELLQAVVGSSAAHFARAIIMPNLVPPVVRSVDADAYRTRINEALNKIGKTGAFTPLMTLYLTDNTDASDVVQAAQNGIIKAVKLYPAGATTNSDAGVTAIDKVMGVLEAMQEHDIVLCVHGEVTHGDVDIFDREKHFLDSVLTPLRERLPQLRIVLEHVTTEDGVQFVQSQSTHTGATITTHHLALNRNDMLVGGIRPHYYCLPILKRQTHQRALLDAVKSGDARFFLGTDSAPHTTDTKESACGCAGVFNAPNTLATLAQVFEDEDMLDRLEGFVSLHGPDFYKMQPNDERVSLSRQSEPQQFPSAIQAGEQTVTVFDPARPVYWCVSDTPNG